MTEEHQVDSMAQQVWDELSIMRTVARLAQAQDNMDREAYRSCFTDTVLLTQAVLLEYWQPKRIAVEDLADMYFAQMQKYDSGHHLVVNHVIDVTGDDATCVADLYAVALLTENGETKTSFMGGRYHLKLLRLDGRWLISERAVTVRYRGESPMLAPTA